VAELCAAALFLIDNPNARSRTLLKFVQGPDFPTGGIVVDPRSAIAEAYRDVGTWLGTHDPHLATSSQEVSAHV
jgi:DNA gyrase/topoisomerase IV subunit A